MNKGISSKLLNQQINKLRSYVTYFRDQGVKIVFYEMPIDEKLKETKRYLNIKRAFQKEFPSTEYNYILTPQSFVFKSKDGIHLTGSGIKSYSSFFKNEAQKIIMD